jgi:hypothetical protein
MPAVREEEFRSAYSSPNSECKRPKKKKKAGKEHLAFSFFYMLGFEMKWSTSLNSLQRY